jgi:thiamine-phosphate pyrophosphorylase
MFNKLICITNRALCGNGFIQRVRDTVDMGIPVVLREKDLNEEEYFTLLREINRPNIIAHTFTDAARRFGCSKIHLPLPVLQTADISGFELVGSSTHSLLQAKEAEKLGANYITAGHVFATDCKKGLKPHGVKLLSEIAAEIDIPIYALGGISPDNAAMCISAGAYGVCAMSGFMKCANLKEYVDKFSHIVI